MERPAGRGLLIGAALVIWAALCLADSRELLAESAQAVSVFIRPEYWRLLPGIPRFLLFRFAPAAVFSVIGWFALASVGCPVLRVIPCVRIGATVMTAMDVLAGFAILGTCYYGLALTGLYYAPMIFAVPAIALIAGLARRDMPQAGIRRAFAAAFRPFWTPFCFVPAAVTLGMMCLPDTCGDALTMHLALAEQALREHRLAESGIMATGNYPLVAEFMFGIAVAARNDVLPHFIQALPFGAALVILHAWCVDHGGRRAGLLALTVAASCGQATHAALIAKPDLTTAGFVVAGMVCVARGLGLRRTGMTLAGAVLLGCGAAVKHNALILLALAACALLVVRRRPPPRVLACWAALAVLPLLPWLAKGWLFYGNPFWPEFNSFFPRSLWDPESGMALALSTHARPSLPRLLALPSVLLGQMCKGSPAMGMAIPLVLTGAAGAGFETAFLACFAAAGFALFWLIFPFTDLRYALPLFVICPALAAVCLPDAGSGRSRVLRASALPLAALLGILPLSELALSGVEPGAAAPYLACKYGRDRYLAERLTTFWALRSGMAFVRDGDRILFMWNEYSYRLPGKCFRERSFGRGIAWPLARECRTPDDIGKKMRQLGCRYLLFNFVRQVDPPARITAFTWNERTLKLWEGFVSRYLEVAVGPAAVDVKNGGLCLYRVRKTGLARPPASIPYLPGVLGPMRPMAERLVAEDYEGYLSLAHGLDRTVPGVDQVRNMVAYGCRMTGRWKEAYDCYLPGIVHGTLDCENYYGMALASERIGRLGEAVRLAEIATRAYPRLGTWGDELHARIGALIDITRPGPAPSSGAIVPRR